MRVEIPELVEQEIARAMDYHDHLEPGLASAFAAEVQRACERIRVQPTAWPRYGPRCRRIRLDRFEFAILYQVREDCILLLTVMHLKRSPVLWERCARRYPPRAGS